MPGFLDLLLCGCQAPGAESQNPELEEKPDGGPAGVIPRAVPEGGPPQPVTKELRTGCYALEGKALGFLIKIGGKGLLGFARSAEYKFWVATVNNGARKDCTFWESKVKHVGKDIRTGHPKYRIAGHPQGGFFVKVSETSLIECDNKMQQRAQWDLRDDVKGKFLTTIAAPPRPAQTYPTENFSMAVLPKDPAMNEPCSPPTDVILEACCDAEEPLPEEPVERQKMLAKYYTMETPLYHEMNKALRDDDLSAMRYYSAYIKELRDVFKTDHKDQIIQPFVGKTWRGITFEDPEESLKSFPVGSTFVWSAFTSMSTDRSVAFGFGNIVFEVSCLPPKEAYEGAIAVYAPASVEAFSDIEGEAEILFPPNVQFQVKSIVMPDGKDEEVTSPMIVCETVAFDSDEGLKEFQHFKKMLEKALQDGSVDKTPPEERAAVIQSGYQRLFNAIDTNSSQTVSKKETKQALSKIQGAVSFAGAVFPGVTEPGEGSKAIKGYVDNMFKAADINGDGTLTFDEFHSFVLSKHGSPDKAKEIFAAMSLSNWTQVKKTLDTIVLAFENRDFSGLVPQDD